MLSPLKAMIDAADKGLDVRFMISSDADIVKTLNETTNIKAAKMGNIGYATMHNKGVIIDNMTWVSSVNWTENSFMNNRECGLLIDSKEVTDFYLQSYMTDWNNYYDGYKLSIKSVESEGKYTLTAENATGACTWTITNKTGSETKETTSNVLVLESLENVVSIGVKDSSGESGNYIVPAEKPTTPEVKPGSDIDINLDSIPKEGIYGGIGAVILAIIIFIVKKLKG